MPDHRRWFCDGGTYFFAVVTYNRRKIFADANAGKIVNQGGAKYRNLHGSFVRDKND